MINVNRLFEFKQVNLEKLQAFGFVFSGEEYEITKPILDNQFQLSVYVTSAGKVDYSVIDAATSEEYTLVKTTHAQGAFVGQVRTACEAFLQKIADQCFDVAIFQSEQTQRIIAFLASNYHVDPEHLWEKSPQNAVFRQPNNQKWFAIMMTIDGKKLSPSLDQTVEIIDLKGTAETVAALVEGPHYYQGYHMNKKYWYTAILNDSISDDELLDKIATSFALTR